MMLEDIHPHLIKTTSSSLLISLFLASCVVIFSNAYYFVSDEEYTEELKEGKIIPDVVDEIPDDILQVEYYNGIEPNLGHKLSAHAVYIEPVSVRWFPPKKDELHTLILIDLDAPTTDNPTDRSYVHWMVTNVVGDKVKKAARVAKYQPILVPEEDKGQHRLVFLCYKQKAKIDVAENFDDKDGAPNKKARSKFSHKKFAKKYDFDRLHALNFFYVKHYPNFTYTTIHPKALDI